MSDDPHCTENYVIRQLPVNNTASRDPSNRSLKKRTNSRYDAVSLELVSALHTSEDEDVMTNARKDGFEASHDDGKSNVITATRDKAALKRRYSERIRKAHICFTRKTLGCVYDEDEPTAHEALKGDDKNTWCYAMITELTALQSLRFMITVGRLRSVSYITHKIRPQKETL